MELLPVSLNKTSPKQVYPAAGGVNPAIGGAGFTLIETLLVVGIFTVLMVITSFGFSRLIPNTISQASESTLRADLRQQQIKSQLGDGGVAHGIAFSTNQYVLFTGSTYNPNAASNYVVTLDSDLTLTSTLPSNTLIFAPASGEPTTAVAPFQDQIILTNNSTNTITTFEINELGVPLVVD